MCSSLMRDDICNATAQRKLIIEIRIKDHSCAVVLLLLAADITTTILNAFETNTHKHTHGHTSTHTQHRQRFYAKVQRNALEYHANNTHTNRRRDTSTGTRCRTYVRRLLASANLLGQSHRLILTNTCGPMRIH